MNQYFKYDLKRVEELLKGAPNLTDWQEDNSALIEKLSGKTIMSKPLTCRLWVMTETQQLGTLLQGVKSEEKMENLLNYSSWLIENPSPVSVSEVNYVESAETEGQKGGDEEEFAQDVLKYNLAGAKALYDFYASRTMMSFAPSEQVVSLSKILQSVKEWANDQTHEFDVHTIVPKILAARTKSIIQYDSSETPQLAQLLSVVREYFSRLNVEQTTQHFDCERLVCLLVIRLLERKQSAE